MWPAAMVLCTCGPAPPPTPEPIPAATIEVAPPEPRAADITEPAAEPKSVDTIVGTLSLTKGAQPVIAGRMLSSDDVAKHFGDKWRSLVGKRFRARGEKYDYQCEPDAQCMQDGVIPLLREVVSIELCRGCMNPAGVASVDCPVTEVEVSACVAVCKEASDACDAGANRDRGRLRRCGSKWVGCRSMCEQYADPNPLCF